MEKRISLTKENIEYLRRAFSHFFPEDTIYSADKPFESGEFNWKNRAHFINFVFRLTGVPIKSERDLASIKKAQLEIEKLLSDAASIEKPIDSNLPDKEARELQELERQRREAEIQETEAQSKESVEEAIRRKQSIYEEIARQTTPKEQPSNDGPVIVQASAKEEPVTKESPDQSVWKNLIKEVQPKVPQQTTYVKPSYQGEVLKDKKVSVVTKEILPEVTLTPEEKERIFDLAQAIKTDPGTVQKIIEEKIQESVNKSSYEIKQNVSAPVIKRAAIDLVEKVKPFAEFSDAMEIPDRIQTINSVSPIMALSNSNNATLKEIIPDAKLRSYLSQQAEVVSLAIDSERSVNSTLTSPLFDYSSNISNLFYPQQITKFEIDENQKESDEGVEISLKDVYDQGKDIWDVWQKISNNPVVTDNVITSVVSLSPTYTPSPSAPIVTSATSLTTKALPATIGAITVTAAGSEVGHLTSWALSSQIPRLAAQNVTGLLTSGGIKSLVSISSMIAPKTIINIEFGKVAFRVISFSKDSVSLYTAGIVVQEKAAVGLALARVPGKMLFGKVSVNAAGQTTVKTLSSISTAAKTTAKSAGTGLKGLNVTLGNAVAKGTSSLLAKLGMNAAAAKVGALVGTGIIPVIGTIVGIILGAILGKIIEKIPWKKIAPWLFGALIGGVAYALAGPLVGVALGVAAFGVTSAAGAGAVTVGAVGLSIGRLFRSIGKLVFRALSTPLLITLISVPILIAFILFVINSGAYITPNSGLYSDIKCVKVVDNTGAWPGDLRSNLEKAIKTIGGAHPKWADKVCSGGGDVNLCYNPSAINPGFFAWHIHNGWGDGCDVYFNDSGVGSETDATFMITHELTHHIQAIDPSTVDLFIQSGANGYICSYTQTGIATESMAEACGLYAAVPSWGHCVDPFQSNYPASYNFAKSFMD